ncbi:hypothetical protein LUZ60_002289 [Juncus effusus]|nr:hypothetical protein LUZ60_002289 [Juncus effusus]
MRSFLKDAEEKKIKGDNSTQQWVRDVRDVSFEIENAIDKYVVEIHNMMGKHVPLWKRCILKPTRWIYVHKLGNKISTIHEKIRTISESRNHLGIQNLGEGIVEERPLLWKPIVPDIDNEEVVGFEVERNKIINTLVDANIQTRQVISIVGPGGLGKTTLAKKIYNNTEVKQYFNLRVWLTISQEFELIYVLKKLYEKVTGDMKDKVEEECVYLSKLNNCLRERAYLIVLDDVWRDDVFEWLKDALPNNGNRSKIIITTRSLDVANLATSSSVYKLPFLGERESLELLLKNALHIPNPLENCPYELHDVARKLAGRCGGLSLAIVVLGRLLYKKNHALAEWSEVEKNLNWYNDGQKCINILATSYHDLPYYLKSCFRYLACFPEDKTIFAQTITRMWIAEGFMGHDTEGTLEDKAARCLEELAQRSLVQVADTHFNGSIESFRVHDLLRDLAIHEAKENDYLLICNKENPRTDFNRA